MERIKMFIAATNEKINTFFITCFVALKFSLIALGGLTVLLFLISSGVLAVIASFSLMYLYSAFVSAFVVSHLWLWFVVPIFGVSVLSFPQAFGLSLLVNYWTFQHFSQHIRDTRTWKEKIPETLGLLSRPWFILLVGWACYHFFI